jgi:transposase
LAALQTAADAAGALDGQTHYVDGTVVRAHQHAAGAHDSTPAAAALGRSRGGFSTKIHLRAEGKGRPLTILVTPGQQHEATVFEPLMEHGAVKRRRGGQRRRPKRLVADKGYRSKKIRAYLRRRGIRQTIPAKRNERQRGRFDRAAYRARNRVERLINQLKQYRRVATRYEKRAENYRAMVVIRAIVLWL